MIYFNEKESVSLHLENFKIIEALKSKVQNIILASHDILGKVLIINDEIQHIEKWQYFYHESIVHIPLFFVEKPENILILGGGDLFAAYEILKYPSVKYLCLVDHDNKVIELMKEYYPQIQTVFNDDRFHLIIADARDYLKTTDRKYDLIINDCFNLTDSFPVQENSIFDTLNSLLSNNGVCSDLIYRHIFDESNLKATIKILISKHKTVLSLVVVPEYPGIFHLLTIWGKSKYLDQNLNASVNEYHIKCIKEKKEFAKLVNPVYINHYLYIPPYIKELLNE